MLLCPNSQSTHLPGLWLSKIDAVDAVDAVDASDSSAASSNPTLLSGGLAQNPATAQPFEAFYRRLPLHYSQISPSRPLRPRPTFPTGRTLTITGPTNITDTDDTTGTALLQQRPVSPPARSQSSQCSPLHCHSQKIHGQFHHPGLPPTRPGVSHQISKTHVLHHGISSRLHVQGLVTLPSPRPVIPAITTTANKDDLWDIEPVHSLNSISVDSQDSQRPALTSFVSHTCTVRHRSVTPPLKPVSYLHQHLLDAESSTRLALRSLTSFRSCYSDEMTTVTAPNSPPELSGSKSSKSSSYHSSSQFSSPDGILNDISHFEDIGLEDDGLDTYDGEAHSFQGSQARSRSQDTGRQKSPPVISSRELVASKRPEFPSLHGQVQNALANAPAARASSSRRSTSSKQTLSSTSTASLAIPTKYPSGRSRSSSPSHRTPTSARSAYAVGSASLRPGSPNPSILSTRRDSWLPSRKTVKELEAEYHDSDDELPDDAALWNVPMSPRPPPDRSWPSSRNGSPDRNILAISPRPTPLEHTVSAPDIAEGVSDITTKPLPKQRIPPRTTSLNHDFNHNNPSTQEFRAGFRDNRAKSWTIALSDMSEEAKHITEALEFHASESERRHEERLQKGSKSSRPSLETSMQSSRSKTFVELPPLQKSNIMIDPLPPSKEKELVLSRTRPSWLPPKDPKEERKHLKEYQRMMAASVEAGKRREQQKARATCEKDNTRDMLNQIWEQYVFPDWQKTVSEHRTRELWWRGISPKVRGLVWERAVGNELALTPETYRKAHDRACETKLRLTSSKSHDETNAEDQRMKGWFEDITNDVNCIWPELNLFQTSGPYHQKLLDVLEAYAMYRRDVGYCFGIHTVAALILLQLPEPSRAFSVLAHILNRRLALSFLTNDPTGISRACSLASQTLSYKFPRLHNYLFGKESDKAQSNGGGSNSSSRTPSPNKSAEDVATNASLEFAAAEVFEPLFRTLFTNILPIDHATRAWDCFVFEGDRILIRTSVAVLGMLEALIFDVPGNDKWEKKALVRQLIGWGPYGRTGDKMENVFGDVDKFMEAVREAGRVDK